MKIDNKENQRTLFKEQAKRDYQRAIELNPENSKAYYALAILKFFEEEDYTKAEELLTKYLSIRKLSTGFKRKPHTNSYDIKAIFLRAKSYINLQQYNNAMRDYEWISSIAIHEREKQQAIASRNQLLNYVNQN